MKSEEALIQPVLLEWARKSMGMSVDAAASRLSVDAKRLRSWELGNSRPTILQLRHIADVYKRPPGLFFLDAPPEEPETIQDYRSSQEASLGQSPELIYAIRSVRERRDVALDLLGDVDAIPKPLPVTASTSEHVTVVAERIRQFLNISAEDQFEWGATKALAGWKSAIEHRDILVFETRKVAPTEARGFSIGDEPLPAIVLNGKDTPTGRTFTLLHELAHILLRAGGLCDTIAGEETIGGNSVERYCNEVAASVLMPSADVRCQPETRGKSPRSTWTEQEIKRISARFGVSREAMLLRLVELSLTSLAFYRAKRKEYAAQYQIPPDENEKSGAPPQHILAKKYNGTLYTRIVLSSFHRGGITLIEAAGHLNVRPKHIDALELEVFR